MNKLMVLALFLLPSCTLYITAEESDDDGPTDSPSDDSPSDDSPSDDSPTPDDGWIIWQPEERQNDPRAGAPEYVYLEIGVDGVELPLPVAPTNGSEEDLVGNYDGANVAFESPDGIAIHVAGIHLYDLRIDDFEDEISVLGMELWLEGDGLHGRIVLVADGPDGVAHDVTLVNTYLNEGPSTGPWSIEVRSEGF